MKIVFFGTPAFPAAFLRALAEDPFFEVVGVVCQPDAPMGRKKILTAPPVKLTAIEKHLPIFQPEKLKDFTPPKADAYVVVAYGRILPQRILDLPRLGTINVHPSLLPKFRGPSPMVAAILAREKETGVSIMKLDAEMDHGPILAQVRISLEPLPTLSVGTPTPAGVGAATLETKIVTAGVPLLLQTLKDLVAGTAQETEQHHAQATFCHLLDRKDGIIDWTRSAEDIEAQVRGLNPWPGTTTAWERDGKPLTLKILTAQISDRTLSPGLVMVDAKHLFVGTGTAAIQITSLQPEGGKPMDAAAFINGYPDVHNAVLK